MLPGIALAALVLAAGTNHLLGRAGPWILAAISIIWLLVNGDVEGRVLWKVTEGHGLTAADLGGLTGLGLAVWGFARMHRHAHEDADLPADK